MKNLKLMDLHFEILKSAKKVGTSFLIVMTILWSVGVPTFLLFPQAALAAVTANGATNLTFAGQEVKAGSVVSLFKVVLSQGELETRELTAMDVTIIGSNGFDADDLAPIGESSAPLLLVRDGDDDGILNVNLDSVVLAGDLSNIDPTTWTSTMTSAGAEVLPDHPRIYWLIAMTSDTAVVGHSFKVTIAANGVTLSADSPTITALTPSDVNAITISDDVTPPTSEIGFPGGFGVPVEAYLDRVFNESLSPLTVNTDTVILQADGEGPNLCTSVSLGNAMIPNTRVVCNHESLLPDTQYVLSFNGVTDVAENYLNMEPIVFTTSAFSGGNITVGPTVINSYPAVGMMNVPSNVKISLGFSMGPEGNMKTGADTIGSVENHAHFTLLRLTSTGVPTGSDICGVTGCSYSWNPTSRSLTITPSTPLTVSSGYKLVVSELQNAQDVVMLGMFELRFMVGSSADSTAPTLRSDSPVNPANNATNVSPYSANFRVAFSEALSPSTVSLSTVRLCQDSTAGTAGCENEDTRLTNATKFNLHYDSYNNAVNLAPIASDSLSASTKYCFEIIGGGGGVKDAVGNAFAATSSANCFTTGEATDPVAGDPKLMFADADNFKLVAHFSEPIKFSDLVDEFGKVVTENVDLQCPTGVTISLTNKDASYRTEFNELEIRGLGLSTDSSCQLTVTNATDLAGNSMDTTDDNNIANFKVLNSDTTGGFLGSGGVQNSSDFFGGMGGTAATFWEKPQRCQPRSMGTDKPTSLECEFPAPAILPVGSSFTLTFPSGFTMSDDGGATRVVPSAKSWMNNDINGPANNVPVIASATIDSGAKTAVLTTGGGSIGSGDMIRFELDRLTTPDTPADGLRVTIVIKDDSGIKIGQTIQAAPFSIQSSGSLSISGTVCKNTVPGGTCGESDTGVANVRVFCDSLGGFGASGVMSGHQETMTDADGNWTIDGLSSGQYGCGVPPGQNALSNIAGTGSFQNISLTDSSKTDMDFKYADLSASGKTLAVSITSSADLDSEIVDVFCSAASSDANFSAPTMKSVTLNGSGAGSTTLKLQPGKTYNCGMGPHIAPEAMSSGGATAVPTFKFMPPRPIDVVVPADSDPDDLTFNLVVASNTITGYVKDGSNNGIANVFVHAAPVGCFDATTGAGKECFGGFSQSRSDGSFTLNVAPGTYMIGANAPGMPSSEEIDVTVGKTGTLTRNGSTIESVTIKMVKSSVTISGQVLDESGNGIKYAQVNAEKIATGGTCSSFVPVGGHADSPTDQSGNFTLYVSNGTWCLRAFSPAYGEINSRTVVIASDTSATGQNLQATASEFGTISGSVTKGGAAAGGAFVSCHGANGGNGTQSSSDGTYSLKVKSGSGYTCEGFIPGSGPLTPQTNITVPSSGTVAVSLSMGNPGTVNVTITGITDAFVDLRSSTGRGAGTGMNNNGVYSIMIPAGTYTVRGGGPKYGELCAGQSVTVTAGGTHAITCSPPANLRSVTGRVYDGTNNIIGAKVVFSNKETGRFFDTLSTAQADPANNFNLTNVPEGTYNVQVFKPGYGPATTTATISGGNLTMSSPITLTKASGANGNSHVINVQLSGSPYTGKARVIAVNSGIVVAAETDKTTGNATLFLTNGTWSVEAYGDNGKKSAAGSVIVTAGSVQEGSTSTLSLTTDITGFTAKSDTQTIVPSSGGLIKSDEISGLELNIPGSTLSTTDSNTGKIDIIADATLNIDPGVDMNLVGTGGYDITPKDSNNNAIKTLSGDAVTLTLPYTDEDVAEAEVDEDKLMCGSYSTTSQSWESFPTTVDTENNKITCQITHFSYFAVMGSLQVAAAAGSSSGYANNPVYSAPSNVHLTADSSKVTITWTDPIDAGLSGFDVLRNNGGDSEISSTAYAQVSFAIGKYIDTNVSVGKTYKYQVRARYSSGSSAVSNVYTIAVPKVDEPVTTEKPVVTEPDNTSKAGENNASPVATLIKDPSKLDELLSGLSLVRKQSEEAKYLPFIKSDAIAFKVGLTTEQETALTNFVSYGISEKTKKLGAGERRAVLRDYLETVGRANVNWEDVERLAGGEKPVSRNLAKEQAQVGTVLQMFIKLTGHKPNFKNAQEDLAWNTLMYRIRFTRDLVKEKAGIKEFISIFNRVPTSTLDWSAVRVLGYAL